MSEFSYNALSGQPKTFLAMTGLKVNEFISLLPYFESAYRVNQSVQGKQKGELRGRPSQLISMEDKLFFILFYLKTYPLQEVLAWSFGLSQGKANEWIHRLTPVLKAALSAANYRPARLPEELLERLELEMPQLVAIDGTERRRQRSLDDVTQREQYSGKKSPHPEK